MSLPSDLLQRGELSKCQNDWAAVEGTTAAAYAFTSVHKALEEAPLLENHHHPTEESVHADQGFPCFLIASPLPSSPNLFEVGTATANSVLPEMTLPFTLQGHMQGLNTSEKHDFVVSSSHTEIPIASGGSDSAYGTTAFSVTNNNSQLTEADFHIDSLAEEAPGIWAKDPDMYSQSRAYEDGTPEWDDEISATPASTDQSDSAWLPGPESQAETSRMHSRVSSVSLELAQPFAVGLDFRHPPIGESSSGSSSVETGPTPPPSHEGRSMWHDANANSAFSTLPPRAQPYPYSAPVLPSPKSLISFPPRSENPVAAASFHHLPPSAVPLQRLESSQHAYHHQSQQLQYSRQDNYFVNQPQHMNPHSKYQANIQPRTNTTEMSPIPYDTYQHQTNPSMPLSTPKSSLLPLKCSCAWRCCELVNMAEREWITSTFSALNTDAQDEYLQGLMQIEDRRSKQKPQGEDQDVTPGVDDDAQAGSKRKLCPSLDEDEITKRQRSCESDSTPPSRNSPSAATRPRKSFNTRFYCRVPAQLGPSSSHPPFINDSTPIPPFDSSPMSRGLARDPSLKYVRVCHSTFLAIYQVSKKRVHKCALLAVQQLPKQATTF